MCHMFVILFSYLFRIDADLYNKYRVVSGALYISRSRCVVVDMAHYCINIK